MPPFHGKAGVEDDRRQHDVEEQFRIESRFLFILAEFVVGQPFVKSGRPV